MNLFTIPLRNIRRRPSKTLLLLLVFSLGVISIVALYQVSLVVGYSLEKKLTTFGANIVISPATEKLSVSYGGFHLGDMVFDVQDLPEAKTSQAIRSIKLQDRIAAVAPKLVSMTKIGDTSVALVGVRWPEERGIKSYWAANGRFPDNAEEILVGSQAAAKLGMKVGDLVSIYGKEFSVSGILFETGSDDDSVILMELGMLQTLLDRPDATSFIEVAALCSACPIEDIVAQISTKLPNTAVKALQNVINQRMTSVRFVQKLALSLSLVILVTAAAMIGLSMLSAVSERKKDIGILRSLGYGKSQVFLIFCLEAGLIGAFAGFIGYIGGFGASFKALDYLALADGATPVFSIGHLLLVSAVFAFITIIAAVYPAWKGASVDPTAALVAL